MMRIQFFPIYLLLTVVGTMSLHTHIHARSADENAPATEAPKNYSQIPKVQQFIQHMHKTHGFDSEQLSVDFAQVQTIGSVLRSVARPPEKTKTWPQYRGILLTKKRVSLGVDFANKHHALLNRAANDYGVPVDVILAILGVETLYGLSQGKHKIFHSLTTLAFGYPRRASFFIKELEEFLLLARDQSFDIHTLTGSYAGAMGYGQFIPSSYRNYAVDYDNDGVKDLFGSVADGVGSIANYLNQHGWRTGAPVAVLANVHENPELAVVNKGKIPKYNLSDLKSKGFTPQNKDTSKHDGKALVLSFEFPEHQEYWLAFENFGVIMSYNPRYFYAMAVFQLAEEIKSKRSAAIVDNLK